MPMLSPLPRRTAKRGRKAQALTPLAIVGNTVEARLAGVVVTALPEGALWVDEAKTLIVSDLHLEKGSAFARRGQMLPPYDTHATLTRLAALIEARKPDTIVSLGDSFHDGEGVARLSAGDRMLLAELMSRCDWVWIAGNHDSKAPGALGGAVRDCLHLGALVLRHEPSPESGAGEIAGHLHPCARVSGRGRSVRRRCFATDGARMVMPAFGAFAGGLNICDEAFEPLFPGGAMALVLGKERVLPAPPERLLGD